MIRFACAAIVAATGCAVLADVEIGDGLCGMRFSEKDKALFVTDRTGADFVKIRNIPFIFNPAAAILDGAEKVSDTELRLAYRIEKAAAPFSFSGRAKLTGRGLRIDFETDAPPDVATHGAMMEIWRLKGVERDQKGTRCGYWRRPVAGLPDWPGVPFEVKSCVMKPYTAACGQRFWCLNVGWSGHHTECVGLRGLKDDPIRRSKFEFLTGCEGMDDPQVVAAWKDGRPFVMSLATSRPYSLWESGEPEFSVTVRPLVSGAHEFRTRVWDFDGKSIVDETRPVRFAAGKAKSHAYRLPAFPGDRGIYFVECAILSNGVEKCFARTNLGVMPPHEFKFRDRSKAAMAGYPAEESAFAPMKRLGVHVLRDGDHRALHGQYGFTAFSSHHAPKETFDPENPKHVKILEEEIVGRIKARGSPQFEFGNEVGWHATHEEQTRLIRCYRSWLEAIRRRLGEEGLKDVKIFSFGIQPDYSKHMMGIMKEEGVFDLLDGLNLHPGRGYYTADNVHGGWVYRGIIQRARKRFAELGYPGKDIHMTECYAATPPNGGWHDSLREAAESTLLNLVIAEVEPQVRDMMFYKLHQGTSQDYRGYPEANREGTGISNGEYEFGLLNRDDSPKPSCLAYAATCEELDGATFVRELPEDRELKLRAFEFKTPRGTLDVVYDRTEGYRHDQLFYRHVPKGTPGAYFRHRQPWENHWTVKVPHKFRTSGKSVTVIDVIGRRKTVRANGGYVTLELDGSPVMVYGLNLDREFAEARKRHPEMQEASFGDKVDYEGEERSGNGR